MPDYASRPVGPSKLDGYEHFIRQKWKEGEREATRLWKTLQEKGYQGQRKSVFRYLQRLQGQQPVFSTNQLGWLFMKDEEHLNEEEKTHLQAWLVGHQKLKEIYQLAQTFQKMLLQQTPEALEGWLAKMEACGVKKLQIFASGLRQEDAAIKAALL